jgi:hypothetical protein
VESGRDIAKTVDMTTPIPDPLVAPMAADLVACLVAAAAEIPNQVSDNPRIACLRPGDRVELLIAQNRDECCEGLMWVRWVRAYPSSQAFPAPDSLPSRCGITRWAVVFELGAVRCAPTSDMDTIPTCAEWDEATLNVYDDGAAIRRAMCCFTDSHPYELVVQSEGQPLTTEGGCVGVAYLMTTSVSACDC